MKNYKIQFVSFQSAIQAPGILAGESTLSDSKYREIEMEYEPGLLVVKFKGGTILVPSMNIKSMVVAPEPKPLKVVK